MLTHVWHCARGLYELRERVCTESSDPVWEKNPLPHRRLEPASVLPRLAFGSHALPTEQSCRPRLQPIRAKHIMSTSNTIMSTSNTSCRHQTHYVNIKHVRPMSTSNAIMSTLNALCRHQTHYVNIKHIMSTSNTLGQNQTNHVNIKHYFGLFCLLEKSCSFFFFSLSSCSSSFSLTKNGFR